MSKNMEVTLELGNFDERSESIENCRKWLSLLREYLSNPEENVGRNMNGNVHSNEVSDRNEEYVVGHWRNGNPVIKWLRTWLSCVHVIVFCGR